MFKKPLRMLLTVLVLVLFGRMVSPSFAQDSVPGVQPFVEVPNTLDAGFSVDYVFNSIVSHTYLRSDGAAVRSKDITVTNNSSTPIDSLGWCYYWGTNSDYTNIYGKDTTGYLDVNYYMYEHSSYGWGMCSIVTLSDPIQYGETYSYTEGITISNHHSVYNDTIYAAWWLDPGFVETYTEDVRWPFNNEGVTADPAPDELYSSQALWHRTSQSGIFTVNLEISLGDTMAVAPLSQGTSPFNGVDIGWEDDAYGVNSGDNIGESGCYLTAATMAMNYYAQVLGVPGSVTPGQVNTWLAQPKGGVPGNPPRGYGACDIGYCLVGYTTLGAASEDLFDASGEVIEFLSVENIATTNITNFEDNLQNGELGILSVNNGGYGHFVLVTGITYVNGVKTLSINDPYSSRGSTTLYSQYSNVHTGVVKWFGPGSDSVHGNHVSIEAHSPLHFVVTDSYGNKTGYDPISGVTYNQIPESTYFLEFEPDKPLATTEPIKAFDVAVLEDMVYRVDLIGTGNGTYSIVFNGTTDDGSLDTQVINGYIHTGEEQTLFVTYDPNEGLIYKVFVPLIVK